MRIGFKVRFIVGFVVLIAIIVPIYMWLSCFIEDRLLSVLIFMSLFVSASAVVAKIFGWERAHPSDEREEYIRMVTVDKATMLWMYFVLTLIVVIVVVKGYNLLEIDSEVLGFIKGLGVSALVYVLIHLVSWVRVYRKYS